MTCLKKLMATKYFYLITLILLGIAVWSINLFLNPDSFQTPDALIYADVARHLVMKQGAVANSTWPMFLANLPSPKTNWPSPYPLLYPLMIALGFLIAGVADLTVVSVSGFFFIITLIPLFLLARKIYSREIATLGCLWYLFNPAFLGYSISGTSETLFTFLVTSSVYLFFLEENRWLFLSGLVIGLASITRFQGFLLLVILLGLLVILKKSVSSWFNLTTGCLLVISLAKLTLPPIAQGYAGFFQHEFWATIASGSFIPALSFTRNLAPITPKDILVNLNYVLIKIYQNLYYFYQKFFTLTLPPILILYLLSFFKSAANKKEQKLKILSLFSLAVLLIFHLVTLFDLRFFQPFMPLVIILASGTFSSFLKKARFRSAVIFTCLFIIVPTFTSPGWGTSIQRSLTKPRKPTITQILGKIAQDNVSPAVVIASDDFATLAWFGNRKSLLLPPDIAELNKIDQKLIPIEAIFLSTQEFKAPLGSDWQKLVDNPGDFGNFYLAKSFEIKPEENYYRIPAKAVLYLKKH